MCFKYHEAFASQKHQLHDEILLTEEKVSFLSVSIPVLRQIPVRA